MGDAGAISCAFCGTAACSTTLYSEPVVLSKFIAQIEVNLSSSFSSEAPPLCKECYSGVVKAVEWREQVGEVERDVRSLQRIILKMMRQLSSLQSNYLGEMGKLEGKIRASQEKKKQRRCPQVGILRDGVVNVVEELSLFMDHLPSPEMRGNKETTQVTNPKPASAPSPLKESNYNPIVKTEPPPPAFLNPAREEEIDIHMQKQEPPPPPDSLEEEDFIPSELDAPDSPVSVVQRRRRPRKRKRKTAKSPKLTTVSGSGESRDPLSPQVEVMVEQQPELPVDVEHEFTTTDATPPPPQGKPQNPSRIKRTTRFARLARRCQRKRQLKADEIMQQIKQRTLGWFATGLFCDVCEKEYKSTKTLREHMFKIHSNPDVTGVGHKCRRSDERGECQRVFLSPEQVEWHQQNQICPWIRDLHHRLLYKKCKFCGKVDKTVARNKNHQKVCKKNPARFNVTDFLNSLNFLPSTKKMK